MAHAGSRARPLALALALVLAAAALPTAASAATRSVRYRTPGYDGRTTAPRTLPAPAPPAVQLSARGKNPQVLVDDAGTAHVVYTEEGPPDVTRYCRIKRGSRACDNPAGTQGFVPVENGDPAFNAESGPPRVLAVGDDLVILSYRYPNVTTKPDGTQSDDSLYMWISEDGGDSFTGPALVGVQQPSGVPTVFGPPDAPRIGVISDTQTGGTFFQAISSGRFTGNVINLAEGIPDGAYSGSLATVNGLPVAAFADLSRQIHIRSWTGAGDPNDLATWSAPVTTAGVEPRLAAGPSGLFMQHRANFFQPFVVRRVNGAQLGPPVRVSDTQDVGGGDLIQDAGGRLRSAWVDRTGRRILVRTSTDGRRWETAQTLAQGGSPGSVDLGAAFDGGGFAAWVDGGDSQGRGQVKIAAFGRQTNTGRPGLGARGGGGLPPGTVSSCQRIGFGRVEVRVPEGCLLNGRGVPGVKVSEGTINLNGLEIVPDAGVKIVLDSRNRTLNTTGTVTVQLRGAGPDPIVLWRGQLLIDFKRPEPISFDMSRFGALLKGFPIRGRVDVELLEKSVRIPVSLELPRGFGGIRGDAVLIADSNRGLHLDTVRIRAPTIPLGVALIRDLDVSYSGGSDTWTGGANAVFPPGWQLGATVRFSRGAFGGATITIGPPWPGLPVFKGVYLSRVTGGFAVNPFTVTAGVRFGAIPTAPPDGYAVAVSGQIRMTFADPFVMRVSGTGELVGFTVATASLTATSDLYFEARGNVTLRLEVAEVEGGLLAVVDGPRGDWSASINGRLAVLGTNIARAEALASNRGIAACGEIADSPLEAGFSYPWGGSIPGDVDTDFGDCDLPDWAVPPRPAGARASEAGTAFSVGAGGRLVALRVTGAGGVPAPVLVSPSGERIVPAPASGGGAGAKAYAAASPSEGATYVAIPSPTPGTWRVEAQPGSPAPAEVQTATALPDPRVTARVRGSGTRRTLDYQVANLSGRAVEFFELARTGGRRLGRVTNARGTLAFRTAGPGGPRRIVAVVEQDGVPRHRFDVASYVSPPAARPGRIPRVRVRRTRAGVAVTWVAGRGASSWLVEVRTSDGRRSVFAARRRSLAVAGIDRRETVVVSVRGRNAAGRVGPAARARLR